MFKLYIHRLFVAEGKHSDLYLHVLMFTKQAAIYSSSFQRAIANLRYYLPFEMASSGYQTLCHVRLPVSDISKSLPHSLVNRQADCGTEGHFILP